MQYRQPFLVLIQRVRHHYQEEYEQLPDDDDDEAPAASAAASSLKGHAASSLKSHASSLKSRAASHGKTQILAAQHPASPEKVPAAVDFVAQTGGKSGVNRGKVGQSGGKWGGDRLTEGQVRGMACEYLAKTRSVTFIHLSIYLFFNWRCVGPGIGL